MQTSTPLVNRLTALGATLALGAASQAWSATPAVPIAQRADAAKATAETSPACVAAQPFYWEIGDAHSALASGSTGGTRYTATSEMQIASASKWVYASYVVQKRGGAQQLTADDIDHLHFTSGRTHFKTLRCGRFASVGGCDRDPEVDPKTVGQFDYSGGHMQHHADVVMGLGAMKAEAFSSEVLSQLGADVGLIYRAPQPAGGGYGTAAGYAVMLRKIVGGQLLMRDALGAHAVCASPTACRPPDNTAVHSPVPSNMTWHYSIGHWVEDGDQAYSSPGAFGFYPWINHERDTYGIVARHEFKGLLSASDDLQRPAFKSVDCGRLIRKAWFSGAAVLN